jgi:hypothetical protein
MRMRLTSWLTLLNDNGQSFEDAELLVVAGRLNVVSDFQRLADPPDARPLPLICYPLGSTAAGSPVDQLLTMDQSGFGPPPPPPPPPPVAMAPQGERGEAITVTGSRVVKAVEEQLADLKLYRVPEAVTVSAKGLKQVAFLDEDSVEGRLLYKAACSPWDNQDEPLPAAMLLATVNDKRHGLGMALPMGGITVFEPSAFGEQLVAEERLRDYAEGQDVELALGTSSQVFAHCERPGSADPQEDPARWTAMRAVLTNASANPVRVRLTLGASGQWRYRGLDGTRVKDGETIVEITVPGNGRRVVSWDVRPAGSA